MLGGHFHTDYPFVEDLKASKVMQYPKSILRSITFISGSNIAEDDITELIDWKIEMIQHRGKLIIIQWGNSCSNRLMFVHLGMTGGFTTTETPHSRIKFDFKSHQLYYNDMRKWGKMGFRVKKRTKEMGASPFSTDSQDMWRMARNKKISLREFLTDQHVISGIGNYLVNEILWRASFHPATPVKLLANSEWALILHHAKQVIMHSVRQGGVTISNYCHLDGASGHFQENFNCYQQKKCSRCEGEITRLDFSGSGHYTCLTCQPLLNKTSAK